MPSDGPGLGWTVKPSWAWRGTDDSELLCDTPSSTTDYWGNSFAGTLVLVPRGNCPYGVKAQNAMLLGAAGIAIFSDVAGDPEVMVGPQIVTIPVGFMLLLLLLLSSNILCDLAIIDGTNILCNRSFPDKLVPERHCEWYLSNLFNIQWFLLCYQSI
jgi:hypothetical protein